MDDNFVDKLSNLEKQYILLKVDSMINYCKSHIEYTLQDFINEGELTPLEIEVYEMIKGGE